MITYSGKARGDH